MITLGGGCSMFAASFLWTLPSLAPWTRDGRVRADDRDKRPDV